MSDYTAHNRTAPRQHEARERLHELFAQRPLPDHELLTNVGLYTRSSALAKLLFLDELYRKVLPLPGVIMVFGTWWGQDLVVLHNLRAVHEPYNGLRRVIGFDTFTGYPAPGEQDRSSDTIKQGAYHVTEGYVEHLEALMDYHRAENAMGHQPTFELLAGNVTDTLPSYLESHPETIISLAYLDLALYEPTKAVLELIEPRMVRGGIIAMDELNSSEYPGETKAYREVFGLQKHVIQRSAILPDRTFTIMGQG